MRYVLYPPVSSGDYSPAWPACSFSRPPLNLPIAVGGLGHGGRAHSPNEYFVIECVEAKNGYIYGLTGCEKSYVSIIYRYAGKAI